MVVAVAIAAANAQEGMYYALGLGNSSCGTWTAARRERQAFGFEQWILGFLSGVGFQGGERGIDPLNGVDAQAVWGWTDNYCQAHPLETIALAGAAFAHAHPH